MLEKEEKQIQQSDTAPQSAEEYIKAVKELKENSVSKEEYDKVVADKSALIRALVSGDSGSQSAEPAAEEKPDIQELRNKLRQSGENELTNAEYVATALQLRKAILEEGGIDPFLPQGAKVKPTLIDIQGAEKVAEGLQHCLDEAADETGKVDPVIFNAHLDKLIAADNPALVARLRASKGSRK